MYPAKLQTIRLLTGLVLMNRERAEGYNKALSLLAGYEANELENVNLQLLLSTYLRDSKMFAQTLENIVLIEGGKMPYGLKADQKLYAESTEMKALLSAMTPDSILTCCADAEDRMQAAYDYVLQEEVLGIHARDMVERQKKEIEKAAAYINGLEAELGTKHLQPSYGNVFALHNIGATTALQSQVV